MTILYQVNCNHYYTDRCNKPNTNCVFNPGTISGFGCKEIELDWINYILYKEHITLVREVKYE